MVELEKDDINTLDAIIKQTTHAIETGKEQIYTIAENARSECERVKKELEILQSQTVDIINMVDDLEKKERLSRTRLMEVDKEFDKFTEDDIKKAYELAREYQVKLTLMRERERQLRAKRDDLGRSLKTLTETAEKAENLISQVGVVLDFLGGKMRDLNSKVESLQQSQQLGLQIIKAQEDERKRVAREIHDGPAQSMANVVLRMEFCEKLIDVDLEKLREELQGLKDTVRGNLQDVRKIIFNLRPMALDDLGFIPALKRYVEDYQGKNALQVKLSIYGEERRFKPTLEIALFRLIQESLNNVQKHANATEINVLIRIDAECIKGVVRDNGVGFNVNEINDTKRIDSFGLVSMRERVEMLEGEWRIESSPGVGTEVHFRIPTISEEGDFNAND